MTCDPDKIVEDLVLVEVYTPMCSVRVPHETILNVWDCTRRKTHIFPLSLSDHPMLWRRSSTDVFVIMFSHTVRVEDLLVTIFNKDNVLDR